MPSCTNFAASAALIIGLTDIAKYSSKSYSYESAMRITTTGMNQTGSMLINTGLAINHFRTAYERCGNSAELKTARDLLTKIINRLEYVQRYESVSSSNYINIVLDIYEEGVYQDVVTYESQLLDFFATL
jgi:hypothetical protein